MSPAQRICDSPAESRQLRMTVKFCSADLPLDLLVRPRNMQCTMLSVSISRDMLPINHLTTIYNNTVAIYNVYEGRRIGLEVVSKTYAQTARSIFDAFWGQAIAS